MRDGVGLGRRRAAGRLRQPAAATTCAPARAGSYVALLADADGPFGAVQLSTSRGVTVLDKPLQAARFLAPSGETFVVAQDKINQDFAAAMAASPPKPVSYLLYFQAGGARLTPEAEAELQKVIADLGTRPVADLSVIGHTDTAGDADANERLGLVRARFVADLINRSAKIDAGKMSVESHGEKNLLIATPDNTNEPRNRRVEVTVR